MASRRTSRTWRRSTRLGGWHRAAHPLLALLGAGLVPRFLGTSAVLLLVAAVGVGGALGWQTLVAAPTLLIPAILAGIGALTPEEEPRPVDLLIDIRDALRGLHQDRVLNRVTRPDSPLSATTPVNRHEAWCSTCQKLVRPRECDGWRICPNCGTTRLQLQSTASRT